nr:unnamed protein product [Callosobruchus analis]
MKQQLVVMYCDPDPNLEVFEVFCKHGKNGKLACQDISLVEIRRCRKKLYVQRDKIKQYTKMSHLIEIRT